MRPNNFCDARILMLAVLCICYFLITLQMMNVFHEPCKTTKSQDSLPGSYTNDEENELQEEPSYDKPVDIRTRSKGDEEAFLGQAKGKNQAPVGGAIAEKDRLVYERRKPKPQRNKKKMYVPELYSHHQLLDTNLTTNMLYFVWCGRRWFEFNHYLSVLSAIKHLKPDNIFFYYDNYPIRDSWIYNTWFEELREEYPFFHLEELRAEDKGCSAHSKPSMTFINHLLTVTGGIYLNENTILAEYPLELRKKDYVFALDANRTSGFVSAKRGLPNKATPTQMLKNKRYNSVQITCFDYTAYTKAAKCVNVHDRIFPKDFWVNRTPFASFIRTLFYGNPEPVDAKPDYDELIPNIAHVVWIGGGHMDYLFYLGILSLIYVAECEAVYIHGNAPPSGYLWARIKDHPKIKIIYRETPRTVFGTRVNIISHVTDVWRVDFMVRYGGIYVDTDTVFVNKLDRDIRAYDAVGTYDWTYWNHPFPDTINFGVAIGKRNAKFWQEFQKSMKWFIDSDWSWNGLRQPYRIKERHPEMMKINPHLQVTCYKYLCHPTWWPDYHNESIHHLNTPSIKDWRKEVYAFHWTLPTPPELDDEKLLLSSSSMAAEVGRYVLEKAGILNELQEKYKNKATEAPKLKIKHR